MMNIKNIGLGITFSLVSILGHAQQMSINTNGALPDSSAMLDISSTNKGLLMPRLNTTQMNGVSGPATGLLIYNTDSLAFYFFNGTQWTPSSSVGSSSASVQQIRNASTGHTVTGNHLKSTAIISAGDSLIQVDNSGSRTVLRVLQPVMVHISTAWFFSTAAGHANIRVNATENYLGSSPSTSAGRSFVAVSRFLNTGDSIRFIASGTVVTGNEWNLQVTAFTLNNGAAGTGISAIPSLDSVLFAGNNANGVNIVNTGKIAIGTATVSGAEINIVDTAANIALTSTNTSSWASMRMETPSSSYSLISSASPSFYGGFFIKDNTANTNRFAIDSTGNVGIGTLSPGSKMHILGTLKLSGSDTSSIFNSTVASRQILNLRAKNTVADGAGINMYGDNDITYPGAIRFLTGGDFNASMWIDSNENVAIGNQVPTQRLDVAGNVKADSVVIYDGTNAPTPGDVLTAIDANGRAYWTTPAAADGNGIYDGSGSLSGTTNVTFGANQLNFITGATQGFNVDGTTFSVDGFNNRVGVGNINPTTTLDVNGGIRSGAPGTDGQLTLYSEQGATDYTVVFNPNAAMTQTTTYTLPPNDGNANDVLTSDGSGSLSWGTQSGNGIYSGSGSLTGATTVTQAANTLSFTSTATNGFSVDGTTFSVDAANNRIGVGTAAPAYPIDVNGAIRSGIAGLDGQFRMYSEQGATDYEVVFNPAAAMTQNTTYTLPVNDGNASQVLTTDGAGVLSWGTVAGDGNGIYSGSGSLSGATTVTQAANTLAFTSTATNGFSVDGTTFSVDAANNRVGFGTSSPTYHMHLLKTTGTAHFTMETQDSSVVQMRLINSVRSYGIAATSYGNLSFIDHNAATNIIRMRLDSTGRFGIGSSNPAYKLDVGGTIRSGWNLTDGQLRIYSEQGATDYEVVFNPNAGMTQTTTYTLPPNDGNASQVLTTDGAGVLSWAAPTGDNLGNHTATQNIQLGSFWLSGDGGNEGIYVNASGRVGFGTNAPAARFHILDNSGPLDILLETPDTASAKIEFRNALHEYRVGVNPDSSFTINDASAGVRRLIMTATGKFGLGMGNSGIPSYTLDVKGAIRAGNNNADGQLRIYSEQGATDYEVVFNPPATMTQNTTYTLPANDGNANDMLISNGSGILSWGSTATIGNGIYSGSGSLTGATTVTQAANTLSFTSTATNGFSVDGTTFSVDGLNNRIGIGTASPAELIHLRATGVSNTLLFQNNNNITTNSNSLGRIHFGDNQTTLTQAAIWADRDGTSSNAADLPTRLSFYTMADGTATLSEKMRITNSGNVGIGTSSPSQLLDVAGNIAIPAANDYTYSTAKIGYASISASAFELAHIGTSTPGISTTTVTNGNYKTIDGGVPGVLGYFHAPVSLPDGAIVTQLDFYIWDNDGTYEASGDLLRINLGASAINTMATTAATGAAAASASVVTVNDNTISFATVDNSLYGYYVRFNTYEITANLRIYGARVTYTVTKAD